MTVALNLMIYIFLGQLLFTSMPIPPFLILLMTSMDTFTLNILATEYPQEGYDIFKTLPKKRMATINRIVSWDMTLNIILSTIYI